MLDVLFKKKQKQKKKQLFFVPEMWSYENMFVFYQSFNILGYFTQVISVSDLKRFK